jgi:hypothetical protein
MLDISAILKKTHKQKLIVKNLQEKHLNNAILVFGHHFGFWNSWTFTR